MNSQLMVFCWQRILIINESMVAITSESDYQKLFVLIGNQLIDILVTALVIHFINRTNTFVRQMFLASPSDIENEIKKLIKSEWLDIWVKRYWSWLRTVPEIHFQLQQKCRPFSSSFSLDVGGRKQLPGFFLNFCVFESVFERLLAQKASVGKMSLMRCQKMSVNYGKTKENPSIDLQGEKIPTRDYCLTFSSEIPLVLNHKGRDEGFADIQEFNEAFRSVINLHSRLVNPWTDDPFKHFSLDGFLRSPQIKIRYIVYVRLLYLHPLVRWKLRLVVPKRKKSLK